MSQRKSWTERLKKIEREQEFNQMIKSIYGKSREDVIPYKWVVTNLKSGVKVFYRKSVSILDCKSQMLVREIDNTTTYYSKRKYKLELC